METIQKANASNTAHLNTSGSGMYASEPARPKETNKLLASEFSKTKIDRSSLQPNQSASNPSSAVMRTDRSHTKILLATSTNQESKNERSTSRKAADHKSSLAAGLKLSASNLKSSKGPGSRAEKSPNQALKPSPDKAKRDQDSKLNHNIYNPRGKKPFPSAEEVNKKFALQNSNKSKLIGSNRSSTPNARASLKSKLYSMTSEEKNKTDTSGFLSGGLKKSAQGLKTALTKTKFESSRALEGKPPNLNLSGRK